MITCDLCGAEHEGDAPPLTWTRSVERGQVRHQCEACTREHLRAIEGHLDPRTW